MTDANTIMARLRAETKGEHDATEAVPLARAMFEGTLSRRAYVDHLRGYAAVLGALDDRVDQLAQESNLLGEVARFLLPKMPSIEGDLRALGESPPFVIGPRLRPSVDALVALVTDARGPVVLGAAYVFEGSMLGAAILGPKIQAALALPDEAIRYYRGYGAETRARWGAFRGHMNAAITEPRAQEEALQAARDAFRGVREMYEAVGV